MPDSRAKLFIIPCCTPPTDPSHLSETVPSSVPKPSGMLSGGALVEPARRCDSPPFHREERQRGYVRYSKPHSYGMTQLGPCGCTAHAPFSASVLSPTETPFRTQLQRPPSYTSPLQSINPYFYSAHLRPDS